MKRRYIGAAAIAAVIIGGGAAAFIVTDARLSNALFGRPELMVVSWGEDYGRAQAIAMFRPFEDESDATVRVGVYGGGLKEIENQVAAGAVDWDVVDLELADAEEACTKGLLEPIDVSAFPAGVNGEPASGDFVSGASGPCWAGALVYSQLIAFDRDTFADMQPATLADFFDLERFPGKRGLKDTPQYTMEMALLADGVAPSEIYALLATDEGAARAIAKLNSIKPAIVWWKKSAEPLAWLAEGRVAMTSALNGRLYDAVTKGKQKVGLIWDRQIYAMDVFAIPKGSKNKDLALDFVSFATGSAPLAKAGGLLPYGPARRSALTLVEPNPETGQEMLPYLPTTPDNFTTAAPFDPEFWTDRGAAAKAKWTAWRGAP